MDCSPVFILDLHRLKHAELIFIFLKYLFYQGASGAGLHGLTVQSHVEVENKEEQAVVFYPVQDKN